MLFHRLRKRRLFFITAALEVIEGTATTVVTAAAPAAQAATPHRYASG